MRRFNGRRIATVAVIGLGVVVATSGAAVAAWVGPDGLRDSGPQRLDTDASVIVTAPEVLRWAQARVHVHASFEGPKAVFIGVGNAVDVQDYLGQARRTEVTSFRSPWEVESRTIDGEATLPAAPTALDWWLAHDAGFGGANLDFTVPPETVQLVILGFEGSDLSGITVEVGYSLPIGFTGALGLIPIGLGVALAGWWVGGGRPLWLERDVDDDIEDDGGGEPVADDVVYVWVDDDGVEHEISAEEAAGLEVVEEVEEVVGVAPSAAAAADDVVYVWVDDDGVEHEISAEEAAGLEVVEEVVEERPGDAGPVDGESR